MNLLLNLNAHRFERLSAALEDLERWAEQSAAVSHHDPSWLHVRAKGSPEAALELEVQEGAESAFADAAARLALVRAILDEAAETRSPRERYEMALGALRAELVWCRVQCDEALGVVGAGIESEERHAEGRAEALGTIADELRSAITAAPLATV